MTKRPTEIRIGASIFRVEFKDYAWFRSTDVFAQFDPVEQAIYIYDKGCPGIIAARFIHEVAHGLIWYHTLLDNDKKLSDERAADLMGYQLADFWRSNPEAFRWYIELIQGGQSS